MATSQLTQSKLRQPGHTSRSRASTGGSGGPEPEPRTTRPASARTRRLTVGGRLQSDSAAAPRAQQLSDCSPDFSGRMQLPLDIGFEMAHDDSAPTSGSMPEPSGHIRVAVRVRPLPENELGIIEVSGKNTVLIQKDAASGGNGYLSSQQGRIESRCFDRVFGPRATQVELYEYSCAPLLREAVAGGRCATVFAYGATGAGKTHTMFGDAGVRQHGIILRAIPDIFKAVAEHNACLDESEPRLAVKASFLEIYNETVRDLLQEGGGLCRVLEDERRGVVQVSNLVEPEVASANDALSYLEAGMLARTIEATAANSQSSRAHAVFSLTIERVSQSGDQTQLRNRLCGQSIPSRRLHSKISFVDLAGSERAAFTQNAGQALKDGARINQSLLALANCIDALIMQSRLVANSTPRRKPPYRDSKLTLMLKSSLMGDGLVAMIANVHPGRMHFEDSNNTLEYAKRASMVKATSNRVPRQSVGGAATRATSAPRSRHHTGEIDSDVVEKALFTRPHTRRSEKLQQLASLVGDEKQRSMKRSGSNLENTTASSPEECLSEISLSSGHDEGEELDTGSDPSASPNSCSAPVGDASPEVASEKSPCDWEESRPAASDISGKRDRASIMDENSPAAPNRQVHQHQELLASLVAKLQKDNERLNARLHAATRERNGLIKDRQELEEENDRLRKESMEKDKQIMKLINAEAENTLVTV